MKTATFFCFFSLCRLPTRKEERACLCSPQTLCNLFLKMRREKRKGRGSDRVGFKSGYSDFARKDVSDPLEGMVFSPPIRHFKRLLSVVWYNLSDYERIPDFLSFLSVEDSKAGKLPVVQWYY